MTREFTMWQVKNRENSVLMHDYANFNIIINAILDLCALWWLQRPMQNFSSIRSVLSEKKWNRLANRQTNIAYYNVDYITIFVALSSAIYSKGSIKWPRSTRAIKTYYHFKVLLMCQWNNNDPNDIIPTVNIREWTYPEKRKEFIETNLWLTSKRVHAKCVKNVLYQYTSMQEIRPSLSSLERSELAANSIGDSTYSSQRLLISMKIDIVDWKKKIKNISRLLIQRKSEIAKWFLSINTYLAFSTNRID